MTAQLALTLDVHLVEEEPSEETVKVEAGDVETDDGWWPATCARLGACERGHLPVWRRN